VITALVLAAGTSSRFGRTKQLVLLRGRPLVQHAVDAVAGAGLDEIVVILGHQADDVRRSLELPPNARTVVNPAYESGLASSLAAGLREADRASEAAVVLLGDQPGIASRHVRMLVGAFQAHRSRFVRLRFRDGPGPALLARAAWPEALALEGDIGARLLMERHPEMIEEVEIDEDVPADVDRPEDLERA
jgi:molybdenum cofactor cytidylyltransferase